MTQGAVPRGTFLKIAATLKARIETDPDMTVLPSAADLMREYKISRGVVLRAFVALQQEGIAEPAPGGRLRVARGRQKADDRPLPDRLAEIITDEELEVGAAFPSASVLADRFGVSRPTMTKALDRLEAAGVLTNGGQGKVRTVRAVPVREEQS
ncbi:GntR family transcriptional regulator [Streptomyces sp. NBC_01571]|uniref:GntR family transcriptional regulator n=1 Tax=Streptomyces sp. NBC_01571 TaxID=2975883 RepID=UPI00225A21B1|nr:GntR family transcriptional regulator [Streptomyces sp. NBC_01571]MCX4576839.1 GntR family transcriptional regulator [Streptomyces sp. NBC_01571]